MSDGFCTRVVVHGPGTGDDFLSQPAVAIPGTAAVYPVDFQSERLLYRSERHGVWAGVWGYDADHHGDGVLAIVTASDPPRLVRMVTTDPAGILAVTAVCAKAA